jgi:hypothetical protein
VTRQWRALLLIRKQTPEEESSFNALVEAHEKAWSIYETNRFSMRYPNGDYKIGLFLRVRRPV